jgi:hypothetical protein
MTDLGKINNASKSPAIVEDNPTNIVFKMKKETPKMEDAASSNYYYKLHLQSLKAKKTLSDAQLSTW